MGKAHADFPITARGYDIVSMRDSEAVPRTPPQITLIPVMNFRTFCSSVVRSEVIHTHGILCLSGEQKFES
jgi:hypothetical protein